MFPRKLSGFGAAVRLPSVSRPFAFPIRRHSWSLFAAIPFLCVLGVLSRLLRLSTNHLPPPLRLCVRFSCVLSFCPLCPRTPNCALSPTLSAYICVHLRFVCLKLCVFASLREILTP